MLLGLSEVALWGAVETGLVYSLVALGVYLSFRVLDFPDLTVDGSFPLGGVVCAAFLLSGWNPWIAMVFAFIAGSLAGLVTAFLSVRFGILHLLASILTMTALNSINIRINDGPNQPLLGVDVFYGSDFSDYISRSFSVCLIVILMLVLLGLYLRSETGLAMRATGANSRMARANGIQTALHVIFGVALSNGLVGLAGALYAQLNGSADTNSGVGTIVAGLAALILGETLMPSRRLKYILVACILGSVTYRFALALALEHRPSWMVASDLNLITSVLMLVALLLPRYWRKRNT